MKRTADVAGDFKGHCGQGLVSIGSYEKRPGQDVHGGRISCPYRPPRVAVSPLEKKKKSPDSAVVSVGPDL